MTEADKTKLAYSEQDTADKLILPYLTSAHGFPSADSLDYQAQHTVELEPGKSGRYDGLYLSGGYPYAVLEAKRYSHELTEEDVKQARDYATGSFFDKPVPFLIVSNGRDHWFYKRTTTFDPRDKRPEYKQVTPQSWLSIIAEPSGEVRRILGADELLRLLLWIKAQVANDIRSDFTDHSSGKLDLKSPHPLLPILKNIIDDRRKYSGIALNDMQRAAAFAIEAISLHFTIKILFIKLIEDISPGTSTPRIIHTLFPREEYDMIGGLFGHKVFSSLNQRKKNDALRLYVSSREFYRLMGRDISKVTWQDIFRYGFAVHTETYGKLFRAENYDRFLPNEHTLGEIRDELIKIDVRSAIAHLSITVRGPVSHFEGLTDLPIKDDRGNTRFKITGEQDVDSALKLIFHAKRKK